MEVEVTSALIDAYWQATLVSLSVVVVAVAAFSLLSFWAGRHIDAKFDKHATVIQAQVDEIKGAVAHGAKEHEDWRKEMRDINKTWSVAMEAMNTKWSAEMKGINEKLTEQEIERRVTQELRQRQL